MTTDHNLLFGVLALQLNFIDRRALVAAFDRWTADKNRPLGEILVELGDLDASQRQLLGALVAEHVKQHGGDAKRSLAAVSSLGSVRKDLEQIADPDLQVSLAGTATLVHHAPARDDLDPYATIPPLAGKSSASGSRFRILRPHARGGLGEVYVAQDEELHREVALKEIQERHADNPASRSRFVLEAEITGGLEHPGIVPVYGLGSYADGRPFYAMRFIKGDSLGEAIERFHGNRLQVTGNRDQKGDTSGGASAHHSSLTTHHSTIHSFTSLEFRKLLGRFIDVCNAIEYAHSRGVLHRDLKPGNIMLGNYGETLVVDWGLAKVVGHGEKRDEGDEGTLRPASASGSAPTLIGSAIGTPQYMSPEQAEGRLDQLGTASDVYSLGATLFALLTGRAAFEAGDLAALLRSVVRGEFHPPRQVNRHVPRALEAVCLKGMALKPADRYPSPRALADDVEHWLADEPVSALPESAAQRLGRWLRRHRAWAQSAAAALVLVTLVSLVAVVFVNAARQATAQALAAETKAKDDATKAASAERAANDKAQRRLTQIEKGNDVLGSIFADLDPNAEEKEGKSLRVLLGERLDRATRELEGEGVGDELAVAKLQLTLAESQLALGYPDKAIDLLTSARATSSAKLGADDDQTLAIMYFLAQAYLDAGKLDLAVPLSEDTFKLRKTKLGPRHPKTLDSMDRLASAYEAAGKYDLAMPLYEETLALRKAVLGPDNRATLASTSNLATAYTHLGKHKQAVPLLEEALKAEKAAYGPEHLQTLTTMNNLAMAYGQIGKLDLAIPMLEETVKLTKVKLGPDHASTLKGMYNLAVLYGAVGKLNLAIPVMEETVKLYDAKFGPAHPGALTMMHALADCYRRAGRLDLAIPLYEKTLELTRAKLGPGHFDTLQSMSQLADACVTAGRLDDALALFEEALALMKTNLGPDHPATLVCMGNFAQAHRTAGRLDAAQLLLEEKLNLAKARYGPESIFSLEGMNTLAVMYGAARKFDQAIPLLEETLALSEKKYGAGHVKCLHAAYNLALTYRNAGRYAEAVPLLEQVHRQIGDTPAVTPTGETSALPQDPGELLLEMYLKTGRTEEAIALCHQEIVKARKAMPADSPQLAGGLATFASPLLQLNAPSEAEPLLRECLAIRERQEPDAWTTFNARSMLGGALLGQEKYADAEPLLLAGYQGMNDREAAIPPQGKIRLTEALGRLVGLYEGWAKPEEAATWRDKLEAAQKASMDEPR